MLFPTTVSFDLGNHKWKGERLCQSRQIHKFLDNGQWLQIEEAIRTGFNVLTQNFILIGMSDKYEASHELLSKVLDCDASIYIEVADQHALPSAPT